MLKEIRIKNLAVFEEASFELQSGLNVISGETGAGKSVLLAALNLALGARANYSLIRKGCEEAQVAAIFSASNLDFLKSQLAELGIEYEEEIIIRRQISSQGKSRTFINDCPVTLNSLQKISSQLIHMTSQHEYHRLLDPESPILFLDQFISHGDVLKNFQRHYHAWQTLKKELELEKKKYDDLCAQEEFLKYQMNELAIADLQENEEEELKNQKINLKEKGKINSLSQKILSSLKGSYSVLDSLNQAQSYLKELSHFDAVYEEDLQEISSSYYCIENVYEKLQDRMRALDAAPNDLDKIEERLMLISDLKRKHRVDFSGLVSKAEKLKEQIEVLENFEFEYTHLEKKLSECEAELLKLGQSISQSRKKFAAQLAVLVQKELRSLDLPKAEFSIQVDAFPDQIKENGIDEVKFFVNMNPGSAMRTLSEAASGGELSRILLALRNVVVKDDWQGTLVFDEVDQGIGGSAAELVGRKLKKLSMIQQILCITHLSQIASFADAHFLVKKKFSKNETKSAIKLLDQDQSLEEIARMLAGVEITESALKHARELIKNSAA